MTKGFSLYEDNDWGDTVLACEVEDSNLDWLSRVTKAPIVIPNPLEWPVPRRAIKLDEDDHAYIGDYILNHLNGTFSSRDGAAFVLNYRKVSV